MAAIPTYPGSPHIERTTISNAVTSRTSATGASTCFTAAQTGSVCYRIQLKATGTTSFGWIYIWISDGSTSTLLKEIPVATATPSATVPGWEDEVVFSDMILENGWSLRVSTYLANSFNVVATGADF